MPHRFLAIGFPLLSLTIAMILVGHDVVMAASPHDSENHGAHADHRSHEHHTIPDAPDQQDTTPCGSFTAARTCGPTRDADLDTSVSNPFAALPVELASVPWVNEPEPGVPPGQRRALLQTWLI